MIRLITVDSGSSGNCYVIESTSEEGFAGRLIIEAGVPFNRVQKALKFDLSGIAGVILSHEHLDHAKYVADFQKRGIRVYATDGTLMKLGLLDDVGSNGCEQMTRKCVYKIGAFHVMPFETEHDAAKPCGFLIDCPDGNRILFATDTYYIKYKFPHVNLFMIECNYEESILQQNIKTGIVHPSVAERVRKSHMSLSQCIATLQANDLSETKAVVLIHLSDNNSKEDGFKRRIEEATGKPVYVAQKNLKVSFF